jgi:hypothetical protein
MSVQILEIEKSPRENKRFTALLLVDGKEKTLHFGKLGGKTYIDHHDLKLRENYRKRHLASPRERKYIQHLTPSPAVLSFWILWGDSTDIFDNIIDLQKRFNEKSKLYIPEI